MASLTTSRESFPGALAIDIVVISAHAMRRGSGDDSELVVMEIEPFLDYVLPQLNPSITAFSVSATVIAAACNC